MKRSTTMNAKGSCSNQNGHRIFGEFIAHTMLEGFAFSRIAAIWAFHKPKQKTLLKLSEGDGENYRSVEELAELHVLSVCSRKGKLGRLEAAFVELSANYDTRIVSCPMLSKLRTRKRNFGLDGSFVTGNRCPPCRLCGLPTLCFNDRFRVSRPTIPVGRAK